MTYEPNRRCIHHNDKGEQCPKQATVSFLCRKHRRRMMRSLKRRSLKMWWKKRPVWMDFLLHCGLFLAGYSSTILYDIVTRGN